MKGVYIGNNRMLVTPVWGGKLVVPSEDLSISPDLVLNGVIEPSLTRFFMEKVKPGSIVVDVGANIGYFSVLFGYILGPTGKLYAYEANPNLCSFLTDNLSINYLHDRVDLFNLAVYSESKTITFFTCNRFMGNSSIHEHDLNYRKNYSDEFKEYRIQSVALDTHLAERLKEHEAIDVLKIDIEGGEYHAFLGMQSLIQQNKIKTIVFELNKGMLQDDWNSLIELLIEFRDFYGKKFFTLDDNGTPVPSSIEELIRLQGYPHVVMI